MLISGEHVNDENGQMGKCMKIAKIKLSPYYDLKGVVCQSINLAD
jgi:hypothetical protein